MKKFVVRFETGIIAGGISALLVSFCAFGGVSSEQAGFFLCFIASPIFLVGAIMGIIGQIAGSIIGAHLGNDPSDLKYQSWGAIVGGVLGGVLGYIVFVIATFRLFD